MSAIPGIRIPVVYDYSSLARQGAAAAAMTRSFAAKAAAPVALTLSLAPLGKDLEKARDMVGKAFEHMAQEALAHKIAPGLSRSTNLAMLAKGAIDASAGKAADLVIRVNQGALRTSLALAGRTVGAAVRGMARAAVLPLTVASFALKVGFGLAQAYAFQQVKKMTGMSTIKLLLIYGGVRVGLAVATRLLKAGVRSMARVATIPFRVALGAFRAGLRAAANLARAAARQIGDVLAIPLRVGGTALGLGLAGTALGGLVGVPAAIGGAIKAASDLNETISKVGYTFNDSAKVVMVGAEEMAAKYGVVKASFLEGAAGIGLIGKAAGQADDKAAAMGVAMARLAADLSSFANLSFEDSLEKIRAGLVGEAEPLRTVGVLLNEDAVKAQALAMGFVAIKGKLDESAKVMARAALIQRGLATASGDLARTSGAFANKARELGGRLQNLAAQMGAYLLPAVSSLSDSFARLAIAAGDAALGRAATFERWGDQLKAAADWLGMMLRNLDRMREIGNILWKNLGANAQTAIEPVLAYMADWTVYLGKLLSRSMEDGIEAALRNSTPAWVKFAGLAFKYTTPAGLLTAATAAADPARAPLETPKFRAPKFAGGDEIKQQVEMMKAAEGLRIVAGRARELAPTLAGVAGAFLGARARARDEGAAREKARRDAMNGQIAFEAARHRGEVARPLPRGFSARRADMPRERAPWDRSFTAPAAATRKRGIAAAELPGVLQGLGMLNARAFGGMAGVGMPGFALAALAGPKLAAATEKPSATRRMAGLAEAGSKEAYGAIARFLGYGGKDRQAELAGKSLVQLEKIANNTAKAAGKDADKGLMDNVFALPG